MFGKRNVYRMGHADGRAAAAAESQAVAQVFNQVLSSGSGTVGAIDHRSAEYGRAAHQFFDAPPKLHDLGPGDDDDGRALAHDVEHHAVFHHFDAAGADDPGAVRGRGSVVGSRWRRSGGAGADGGAHDGRDLGDGGRSSAAGER